MKMYAMAGLVFAADVAAVLLIVLSLWVENWLGLERGVVLDVIVVAAVCYGVAGWIVGKLVMWELSERTPARTEAAALEHHPHPAK